MAVPRYLRDDRRENGCALAHDRGCVPDRGRGYDHVHFHDGANVGKLFNQDLYSLISLQISRNANFIHFGKMFWRLASVVLDRRSFNAFSAIWRLRSMSFMSTPGIDTTDDRLDDVLLRGGACGLINPMRRKRTWIGLTSTAMNG